MCGNEAEDFRTANRKIILPKKSRVHQTSHSIKNANKVFVKSDFISLQEEFCLSQQSHPYTSLSTLHYSITLSLPHEAFS